MNFRGETFTFAILTDYESLTGYGICEVENETEHMNESIKERNEYIYDAFNGKTETVKMSAAALNGALEAGNCEVDFVYAPYGAVNTKYCYDTASLGVDFTKPWLAGVASKIGFGGKSYAIAGCFLLETYDSMEVILFNKDVKAKAIIAVTLYGQTARGISKYRPYEPIVAATPVEKAYHQLSLSWGVYPVLALNQHSTDELFLHAVDCARNLDLVQTGDLVVITAGVPLSVSGTTNLLKVQTVG
jgi:hypothetical protein